MRLAGNGLELDCILASQDFLFFSFSTLQHVPHAVEMSNGIFRSFALNCAKTVIDFL